MPTLADGTVFAGHRIEEMISRGGMGIVYRATHLRLGRPVAIKVLIPELSENDDFRARFQRESLVAAEIDHPHVIPLYEAGDEDGMLFLAMRYVDGRDLGSLIRATGCVDPRMVASLVAQVASALDAAHGHGLLHRDVKPENVLLAPLTGGYHAYLTDFGISKRLRAQSTGAHATETATGVIVGSLDYLAPEHIEGKKLGPAADIYALGCLAYHALTGRVPYPQRSAPAKMFAHVQEPPPSLRELVPDLPAELDSVVQRAMAKQPGQRYPTAGEFAIALAAAVDEGRPAGGAAPGQREQRVPARPPQPSPVPEQRGGRPAPARAAAPAPQHAAPAVPPRYSSQPIDGGQPGLGQPIAAPIPSALRRSVPPEAPERRSQRLLIALAAAALIAVVFAVVVTLAPRGGGTSAPPAPPPASKGGPAEAAVRVTVNDFARDVSTGAFGNACQRTRAEGLTVDGKAFPLASCTRALSPLQDDFAAATIQRMSVDGPDASVGIDGSGEPLALTLTKRGNDWFVATIDHS